MNQIKFMSEFNKSFQPDSVINYSDAAIVSKTIIKKSAGTVTFFAFDAGESLSEHTAPYDVLLQVLDGNAEITLGNEIYTVLKSQAIILPANIPHAVKANERFKMMLTMIKA